MAVVNFDRPRPTQAVYQLTARQAELLCDIVLLPEIKRDGRDVKYARLIRNSLRPLQAGTELRVHFGPAERRALEWLYEELRWLDYTKHFEDGAMRFIQTTAPRLRDEIGADLSDAHMDTLADPQEVA